MQSSKAMPASCADQRLLIWRPQPNEMMQSASARPSISTVAESVRWHWKPRLPAKIRSNAVIAVATRLSLLHDTSKTRTAASEDSSANGNSTVRRGRNAGATPETPTLRWRGACTRCVQLEENCSLPPIISTPARRVHLLATLAGHLAKKSDALYRLRRICRYTTKRRPTAQESFSSFPDFRPQCFSRR